MKASWYAEALYGALQGKSEHEGVKIFARFQEVIRTRGHHSFLRFIPQELGKIVAREESHRTITLVTADSKSSAKWIHAYDHYEKEQIFPTDALRKDAIDPSLVGGYQIRTKELFIDGSYKTPLIRLYRNITND